MSAPDPADPDRCAPSEAYRSRPPVPCPSCGEPAPPRRRFCTEQCRTALHRIRRTEADVARLHELMAATSDEAQRRAYATRLAELQAKAAARARRLAEHRASLHGASDDRVEDLAG